MTGRLIKVANAAVNGPSEPVLKVDDAVMRLGVRTVRNLALGFSLITAGSRNRVTGFDYGSYWSRALARAITSRYLTPLLSTGISPAEVYPCGLLSGLAHLALLQVFPAACSPISALCAPTHADDPAPFQPHELATVPSALN